MKIEIFTDGNIWAAFENDVVFHIEATEDEMLHWAIESGFLYKICRIRVDFQI